MNHRKILTIVVSIAVLAVAGFAVCRQYMLPTRIIVVNALKTQQADIVLCNDHPRIKVDCVDNRSLQALLPLRLYPEHFCCAHVL